MSETVAMDNNDQTPLLELRGLHVAFAARGGTVQAVDGVDLRVHEGETIGIVGESGCGKSATARAILRLLPANAARIGPGEIRFSGRDLLALGDEAMRQVRGRKIAMIFQDPMTSLNPVMTIGAQIGEALAVHEKATRAKTERRVVELLELVGIPSPAKRMHDYPHQFSGGMRQRAVIAMALACRPSLVLADEITTALDVTLQAQILELLKHLSQTLGMATVMITHDLGVVAGMTSRVNVMYAGQIVETAPTDEIFDHPTMPYTWGLLRSAPNLEAPEAERLTPIEGLPPDLSDLPDGCRFAPRCPHRRNICGESTPALAPAPGRPSAHLTRCWGAQDVPGGGWLIGHNWQNDAAGALVESDSEDVGR
ncbi:MULTISPECIES: ABC transporter ATP-binding protein [unclassified Roseitalea]|uniref:ABC transporter ATP-binding protein n=1 Tax=unclassified Roseitalea TaxID=2639107 RepID=UPI00273ECE60|nr:MULTISPECIES: ABC transporter ATP-binding protein [unclassified Roseitalea]